MNHFTREELQIINLDMTTYVNIMSMLKESPIHKELRDKIQSMIDNYCEHDWRKGVHLFNDVYCTKCKLHFEVNNNE